MKTIWTCAVAFLAFVGAGRCEVKNGSEAAQKDVSPARLAALKASTQMNLAMMAQGIQAYTVDYGKAPPVPPLVAGAADTEVKIADIFQVVTGVAKGPNADNVLNPRRTKYVEIDPRYVKDDQILDAWGHPVHVMLDADVDGVIVLGDQKIMKSVILWSNGPNGLDEKGAGDDVVSWK